MGLGTKLNLILVAIFLVSMGVVGYVSRELLRHNAREQVLENARLMMQSAQAVRSYTVEQIRPLLSKELESEFLPQTVPAYAATETFQSLHKTFPDFSYREAALNPTNPRDRAMDWEADVIQYFRTNPESKEMTGERESGVGKRSLFLSQPIAIKDPACLTCHDKFADAPRPMLKKYGLDNGFGWKLNEVVAAQIVSVPLSVAIEKADRLATTLVTSLCMVFLVVMVVLNIMLRQVIINPLKAMSKVADDVSSGNLEAPELTVKGNDEVSSLIASFNRMRRSIENAIRLLDEEKKQ